MIITHSSLECFKCCRRKYKYRYLTGICPKEASNALQFGSAMHEILQQLFETIEAQQHQNVDEYEAKEQIISRLQSMIDIADLEVTDRAKLKGLISGYVNKWYDSDCKNWEIVDVEREFNHQVGTIYSHVFCGKADGIIKDKETGKYYILEHKTAALVNDDYISQKQIDSQTMTYATFLSEEMGIEISGAIHDIITKQKIRLKKGESEDEFCQRLIEDVSEENFERVVVEFDKNEINDFYVELMHSVNDLIYCDSFYRCTGQCIGRFGACEYLPLCRNKGDLSGIEELYTKRKPHEEISDNTLEGE